LTKSQQVLIKLLKKSLFNFEAEIPTDVDWQEVYDEANFQSVIPLVYDATAGIENIPEEVLKKFKSHTVAVMFNNDKIVKAQGELCELFEKNDIKYAILKGLSIAKDYPKPDLRTLGDVDVLVEKNEYQKVKRFLIKNGYQLINNDDNHFHCTLKKSDVVFELHFEMTDFPDKRNVCQDLKRELDNALNDVKDIEFFSLKFVGLGDLYQSLSLLLHMERHLRKDGLGIRQILDWGFFALNNGDFFENEKINAFYKEFGLLKLATTIQELFCKCFLNENIENNNADLLLELVLKKGNFGVKNDEDDLLSNRILADRKGLNKIFVVRYFRYFKIRSKDTWEVVKRHKWLSNFAIIYLPIRYLFRLLLGRKKMFDYKKVISTSKQTNEVYENLEVFEKE